ncbi:MAG: ferrous iron transport protein B [Bdellovibrio sp. CG12_big_fil_rev_8_21_14_0_65_39_13]|nr:MAG: ferrous iron transport protein B [Bdellovibrio sp. CG22_combo_CG10-13_8_21_14_all_39_27]PIQ58279.1 MAG: ferrous iron transport protein B [Bdellovibrio sp. CG12_big_fil_rev_8_21_14_0_65_39_13]PIR36688.1 MAG: ferrous iron transport protein B [Bdellovibrio sp. CG11_big_fil_rev_8_21_14_0_20_39_38]
METLTSTVFLVGFPNSGKSTVFNLLTGGNRKVSNYSGVTVDAGSGELTSNSKESMKIEIVDLPGIYNLNPNSIDEGVTVGALLNLDQTNGYDQVIVVLDWQRIEASLGLALTLKKIIPEKLIVLINKDDERELSKEILNGLEQRLGLKVESISALADRPDNVDKFIRSNIKSNRSQPNQKIKIGSDSIQFLKHAEKSPLIEVAPDQEVAQLINQSHHEARALLKDVVQPRNAKSRFTQKLDSFVLHPLWGGIIFLAVFYLIFNAIYTWAGPAMDLSETLISALGNGVSSLLPDGLIKSVIVDGVIAGVGGVVVFLPQIMFLFFLLSLLEQSGYISRAAVVTDRIMSVFGLNGKAFLPYMSGFACAIPGIMATRTIPNPRERLATMMTLPLITCSARLPVYILLIGTFVPNTKVWGVFNAQALSFFFLYFLGSVFALVIAKLLRLSIFKGETGDFIIDLPLYQRPSLKVALRQALIKAKVFLKKAGTVILGLSIAIWFLSNFPQPTQNLIEGKSDLEVASITLQHSMLGTVGRTIEPVIKPLGMDWKMGVGLLVAFGARELFVSAMGTIYALGDVDEESESLRERLMSEINPETGLPVFNLAVAWSILIFFVFALQCTSTLAILKKETGGWKIPMATFVGTFVLAWTGSFIVYHLLV